MHHWDRDTSGRLQIISTPVEQGCNTPKYTLVIFDMFRVFCEHNLTVS